MNGSTTGTRLTFQFSELLEMSKRTRYTTSAGEIDEDRALELACKMILDAKMEGGTVYAIGNGGSSGTATHFSLELLKNLRIPASSIADFSLSSSIGNDLGFEQIFQLPAEVMLKSNDLLIILSGSGQSPNLLRSIEVAKQKKTQIITLTGCSMRNPLRQMGDLNFWFNSSNASLIEAAHFVTLHTIVDLLIAANSKRDSV